MTHLIEFASKVVTYSSCLSTLEISYTGSRASDGVMFMQTLADHEIHWLKSLNIKQQKAWFKGGGDDFIATLITVIARQTDL